jgi:hypothetical protein
VENGWRSVAGVAYYPGMPFADPNNPDRPLTMAELRAMLDRGRAEAEAGQGTDLELLLSKWDAEDAADHPTRRTGKPAAAQSSHRRRWHRSSRSGGTIAASGARKPAPA